MSRMARATSVVLLQLLLSATLAAQQPLPRAVSAPSVGPPRGTVLVVGGGVLGAQIQRAFIAAAGGPDALIVDIPTAGGDSVYGQDAAGAVLWRRAGARHVVVLHTTDRAVANSDSFVASIQRAKGVWFDGGRQYHLVDAYAGTRAEAAFHDVLARGGVVGGSSAGATILGDFLVRGAPSNDNFIMDDPSHEKGFAFLRGVAIDQHVVARSRLADLADSIAPKYPRLLPMSEDEGTAWMVRGDTAAIIGAGQAFAYQAATHDPGKPFVTLHPGDTFNLATRQVMHRASDDVPALAALVDSLFAPYGDSARGGATVLVARDGNVLIDRSFGIPPQPKYMPTTTLPLFDVGGIATVFRSLCAQLPTPSANRTAAARGATGRGGTANDSASRTTPFQTCVSRTIARRAGIHRTHVTSAGAVESDVDELYRLVLALDPPPPTTVESGSSAEGRFPVDIARGWRSDTTHGVVRYSAFARPDGTRAVLERIPSETLAVIILTNDLTADARTMGDRVVDLLLTQKAANTR